MYLLEPSGSGILPDPTALVRPRLSLDHVDIDEYILIPFIIIQAGSRPAGVRSYTLAGTIKGIGKACRSVLQ
jgi:hypothetical protein